jgi:hypothetical protein
VDDWNIRGTVGNGTFGVVNAAKNTMTGKTGAAKAFIRKFGNHAKIIHESIS